MAELQNQGHDIYSGMSAEVRYFLSDPGGQEASMPFPLLSPSFPFCPLEKNEHDDLGSHVLQTEKAHVGRIQGFPIALLKRYQFY